jgi:acyl-CoA dehydrogenase
MDFTYTETQNEIRAAVRRVCDSFGLDYWRRCDEEAAYPKDFVNAMTAAGWLAALIPEAYGGSGLSLLDACVILEEINRSGGNAAACHAQMYTMASILRHGSEAQKRKYLPSIAAGGVRLQAFGVTEPDAGSNTLRIKRRAATRSLARRSGPRDSSSPTSTSCSRAQRRPSRRAARRKG